MTAAPLCSLLYQVDGVFASYYSSPMPTLLGCFPSSFTTTSTLLSTPLRYDHSPVTLLPVSVDNRVWTAFKSNPLLIPYISMDLELFPLVCRSPRGKHLHHSCSNPSCVFYILNLPAAESNPKRGLRADKVMKDGHACTAMHAPIADDAGKFQHPRCDSVS